jgi:hypothetical protein
VVTPISESSYRRIALYGDSATCSATEDIERVETFAGRASPRGLVLYLASAVEQRRTGLGPNFVARPCRPRLACEKGPISSHTAPRFRRRGNRLEIDRASSMRWGNGREKGGRRPTCLEKGSRSVFATRLAYFRVEFSFPRAQKRKLKRAGVF